MKSIILFLSLFCYSNYGAAQITELNSWVGHFEGLLFLEFPNGKKDSLEIHLDLVSKENPGHFDYKVSFFSEKYGDIVKDYAIKVNPEFDDNKHFILDEKDGILIDEVLLNNTLYSQYSVAGSNFQTVLRKEKYGLYYEIVCSSPGKGIKSKSEPDEDGDEYEVESSLVYTIQFARLFKK